MRTRRGLWGLLAVPTDVLRLGYLTRQNSCSILGVYSGVDMRSSDVDGWGSG